MEGGTKGMAISVALLLVAVATTGCVDDDGGNGNGGNGNGDEEPTLYNGTWFRFNLNDTYTEYELNVREGIGPPVDVARLYVALDNIADGNASMDGLRLEVSLEDPNGTVLAERDPNREGNVSKGGQEIVLVGFPAYLVPHGAAVIYKMELALIDDTKEPSRTPVDSLTYEDVAFYKNLMFRINLDDSKTIHSGTGSSGDVRLAVAIDNIADGSAPMDHLELEGKYYVDGVQQWVGIDYAYPEKVVPEGGQEIVFLEFSNDAPLSSGAVLEFKLVLSYEGIIRVDEQTYEETY